MNVKEDHLLKVTLIKILPNLFALEHMTYSKFNHVLHSDREAWNYEVNSISSKNEAQRR